MNYEMTQEDLNKLITAMKPVPYMVIGGTAPISQQENANEAWSRLGKKMGFDPMTVRPNGRGDRFFTANEVVVKNKPHVRLDGDKWFATNSDFINLQESPAGFGDTPAEALADLAKAKATS